MGPAAAAAVGIAAAAAPPAVVCCRNLKRGCNWSEIKQNEIR